MDDQAQARERGGRLDELPEHEDDSDVAGQVGGGVMGSGGTAVDRGTGTRSGIAQGPDAGENPGGWDEETATPGIVDFTDAIPGAGDGAAGQREGRLDREADRG